MSLRTRITGLALAAIGLVALLAGPGSGTAHALTGPCVWNEDKQDWDYPPAGSGQSCANDSYSAGVMQGYVGTRGAILTAEGKPTWAEYDPDRTTVLSDGRTVFVPGVPKVIHVAEGDYEGAAVLSEGEVAFAVQTYDRLRTPHPERVELVRKTVFLTNLRRDKAGNVVPISHGLNPRTLLVLATRAEYTEPGTAPLLAEFPIDPSDSSFSAPFHTNYLVKTKDDAGTWLYNTDIRVKNANNVDEEGTIAYLSSFFSETTNPGTRWGFCSDSNGGEDGKTWANEMINGLPARDDVSAFDGCDAHRIGTLWGPMWGAWVDSASRRMLSGNGITTQRNGGYQLDYLYLSNSMYTDTMYVTLNYQPIDPRSKLGSRWLIQKRVLAGATLEFDVGKFSAYSSNIGGLGISYATSSTRTEYEFTPQQNGFLTDSHKPRSANFPVEVAYMNGYIAYLNQNRPGVPASVVGAISVNENDQDDGGGHLRASAPHYVEATPSGSRQQVPFDPATGQPASAGSGGSMFINRVQYASGGGGAGGTVGNSANPLPTPDGTPNPVFDDGLLADIGRSDFANTDVHVFGPNGDLVTTRIGLRQNESPGLECSSVGPNDPTGHPTCQVVQANPQAFVPIADFIRNRYPGARYKIVVVNRSTGYMGTGWVRVQDAGKLNGLDATPFEGSEGTPGILMRPPNLKVQITRVPNQARVGSDLCRSLAPNEPCEQTIGFEGGGLMDDMVTVKTEWLDWDGSPLPNDLPGFTARLSRATELGTLTSDTGLTTEDPDNRAAPAGDLSHFQIRPNSHLQIVRLPNPHGEAYHYYMHVSGANADRCGKASSSSTPFHESWEWFTENSPACASFAHGIDTEFDIDTSHRPARYVPIKVPVFDAHATADALSLQLDLARNKAQDPTNAGQLVRLPKIDPIYTYVYRPEAQFSIYELADFTSPELVTKYDADSKGAKTSLSFGYQLGTTGQASPLAPKGSAQDPTWSLGFDELLALVNNDNAKASWDNLESLLRLSPAEQLNEVEGIAGQLQPPDYLALQLYLANDRGNPLYVDYDIPYPLITADVAPIHLLRRENLTHFGPGTVSAPPLEDAFQPIRFEVNKPACLTISALPYNSDGSRGTAVELVRKSQPLSPVTHYYVLDTGYLTDKGVRGNFTLQFNAETCSGPTATSDGESPVKLHRLEIEVTQETSRSARGVGEIVEHNVNVLDGSLRLSRQDFSIPGRGPSLTLTRQYTNLGKDSDGVLGSGWSHSWDMELNPLSTEETSNLSVPDWVSSQRGGVTPCPGDDCEVAHKLFPTGSLQLTVVQVNGVTFRNIGGQQWAPESGRHSELIQHCSPESPSAECFEFKSKDGTSYFYDYPTATGPTAGHKDTQPTMLGLSDGLVERLGMPGLAYRSPSMQEGHAGSGLKPTLAKRIRDRFGYELVISPDGEGRVSSIQERDGQASGTVGRSCRFIYEPDPAAGCEDDASSFTRLRRVSCLEGLTSALSGPLELRVDYCYNDKGNLQQVKRGRSTERYEYEHEGGASPDLPNEAGNLNLMATVVMNEGAEQRTSYTYRSDPTKPVFTSPITPEPIDLFDMVDTVTYPATNPMQGEEAVGKVQFGYEGDTRSIGDVRGAPYAGRTYTINTLGNPTKLVEQEHKTTTFEWSYDVGSSVCGTTPPGDNQLVSRKVQTDATHFATTSFAYDEDGNTTEECNQVGSNLLRVSQEFGPFGQVKRSTDHHGVQQTWDYDPTNGFLRSHLDGAGVTTEYSPSTERRGKPATVAVHGGGVSQTTEYHYDTYGNLVSTILDGLPTTEKKSQFDARSRVERQWDQLRRERTFEYDINDNLVVTHLPAVGHAFSSNVFEVITTTYDDVGNKKRENDRNGLVLDYQYTLRNQLKTVKRIAVGLNASSHIRDFRYDLLGNIRSETDWKGNATVHEYDEYGFRNKTISREVALVQSSTHDFSGNVTSITDSGVPSLTTEIRYDELNREVWRKPQCSDPDCGQTITEYPLTPDVSGPPGAPVVYSVRRIIPGSEPGKTVTARVGYDAHDKMVVAEDGLAGHRAEWNYDALGRLTRSRNEEGVVTTFGYDARGFQNIQQVRGRSETNRGLVTEFQSDDVGNVLFKTVWKDAQHTLVLGVTYDAWDRPITQTAPGSNTEETDYDGMGNVVRRKDAGGRVRTWEFDQRGFLVHAYDAEVASRTAGQFATPDDQAFSLFNRQIDANGHPEIMVDALGVVTHHVYDKEERVTSITEAEGTDDAHTREFRQIDGIGNPHEVTDWKGNATQLTYTAMHNVWTSTDPLLRVVTHTYDGQGNEASIDGPRPNVVRKFKRDDLGRVTDVYFPSTSTLESHTDYNKVGDPLLVRNQRDSVTHNEYDDYLRLQFVRKSLGDNGSLILVLTNEYDDAGNVIGVTDALRNRTAYEFNARNLLWKTILPAVDGEAEEARTELRDYHDSGALRSVTAPHDAGEAAFVTTYAYDKEERVISTTAAGETTTQTYDLAGRPRTTLLPEAQPGGKFQGKAKRFDYDKLGRLNQVTDEVNLTTRYAHDKNDNLTDVVGPFLSEPTDDTPRVHYAYNEQVDRLQELKQYRKGGRQPLTTAYDGFDESDNVKHITDAIGRGFNYSYDAYNRRTQAVYPHVATALNEPKQIDWDFNDRDNVITVTETKKPPSGADLHDVTVEHYDPLFDRLQSATQRGFEVSYTYDDNGNRTSVTSPQGSTGYTFDERNRLETVTIAGAQTIYRYHQDGRARDVARGNGAKTSFDYYPTLRLQAIHHDYSDGGSAVVAYAYDHNGNRVSVGDTRNGLPDVTTFDEYDAANRLVQFTQDGKVTRYGYERYNRRSETVTEGDILRVNKTYAVDETERLTKVTDDVPAPAIAVDYSYDDNGNTLARTVSNAPAERNDFEYDARDQLVRVTRGPPGGAQPLGRYDYDADGKRTRHLESERGDVEYIYDADAVVEERISTSNDPPLGRTTRYHYGQELLAIAENAGIRYFHQDALGSTSALSDDAGVDIVDYKHDPYGNVRSVDGDDTDNRQTYTGQEYDERTALYYFGARYYDPVSARFITQDSHLGEPGTPASLHRYLYAYSNPLSYVDPTGHDSENPVAAADKKAADAAAAAQKDEQESIANSQGSWGSVLWSSLKRGVKKGAVGFCNIPGEIKDSAVAFGTSALDHGLALAGVQDFKDKINKQDEAADKARQHQAGEWAAALFATDIESARSHSPGIATAIGVLAGDKRAVGDAVTGGTAIVTETLLTVGAGKVAATAIRTVGALARAESIVAAVETDAAAAGQAERSAAKASAPVGATRPAITREAVAGRVEAALESGAPGKSAAAGAPSGRAASAWQDVTKAYARAEERTAARAATSRGANAVANVEAAANNVGEMRGAARGAASEGAGALQCPCFAAGTLVSTENGLEPIDEIQVGEKVLSRDEHTGLTSYQPVTQRFVTPDKELTELKFALPDGTTETIYATPTHPFWVEGQGWVVARDLELGVNVETAEHGLARLSASLSLAKRDTVYNLEVEGLHTYFVGHGQQWVHNACRCGTTPKAIPGDADYAGRLPTNSWRLTPGGEGAHLVERANVAGKPGLSAFDQAGTPRFYPEGSARNAGQAHIRLHRATSAAGIELGGTKLSQRGLLDAYERAYSDPALRGIRGELRTPNGSLVLGKGLTPAEAMRQLRSWANK